jgi:hypothetical protein
MSESGRHWRALANNHVLFFSYRWLAWFIAGLALVWPGRLTSDLPREAGLLLLSGVITVLATATALSYVRIARQRPLILGLDLLAGAAFVWATRSQALPFLPLAFGSLILPAALYGWRGALIGGGLLVLLDQFGMLVLNANAGQALYPAPVMLGRGLLALAFGLLVVGLAAALRRRSAVAALAAPEPPIAPTASRRSASQDRPASGRVRLIDSSDDPVVLPTPFEAPLAANLMAVRASAERGLDSPRQAIYALTPGLDVGLSTALDQLAESFGRSVGLDVQLRVVGPACPISVAYHGLLLRLAQEALLNVQQHARAHSTMLTLSYEPHMIRLAIQDDGVGLLDGTHERPGVHALRAMRYRLSELDGLLEVAEGESGGVTVRASLPLDERAG